MSDANTDRPALSPPAEGESDQIERWGQALFEANAFYSKDGDDALTWAEMASPDGGIRDLHADMARAAKAVWDREPTPTPAPVDWNVVGPKLVEALLWARPHVAASTYSDKKGCLTAIDAALATTRPQSNGE